MEGHTSRLAGRSPAVDRSPAVGHRSLAVDREGLAVGRSLAVVDRSLAVVDRSLAVDHSLADGRACPPPGALSPPPYAQFCRGDPW